MTTPILDDPYFDAHDHHAAQRQLDQALRQQALSTCWESHGLPQSSEYAFGTFVAIWGLLSIAVFAVLVAAAPKILVLVLGLPILGITIFLILHLLRMSTNKQTSKRLYYALTQDQFWIAHKGGTLSIPLRELEQWRVVDGHTMAFVCTSSSLKEEKYLAAHRYMGQTYHLNGLPHAALLELVQQLEELYIYVEKVHPA